MKRLSTHQNPRRVRRGISLVYASVAMATILLMVSLIGLTMFPMASAPIWRQLFGADDIDFNDLRRHTLVLLDRGLELDHAK